MFAKEQYVGIASIPALPLLGKAKQLRYATVLPRRKAISIPFCPRPCRTAVPLWPSRWNGPPGRNQHE